MARPRKSASTKKGNSESKAQLQKRLELEQSMVGSSELVDHVPPYLDSYAQVYYLFIVENLKESNIPLANLDIPTIAQMSDCLSKMQQCDEVIASKGLIIDTVDRYGNPMLKENPAVKTKIQYLTKFNAMAGRMGMDVSSRASIAGAKIENERNAEDPLLQLLSNR